CAREVGYSNYDFW
nr:immunoglobulin heavy chain junction region [Macaca mulatta]MOW86695.1 immunoglobulin heavy chain junction region [Macaca mulatta]MOW86761.1 immunoglobulin heavy chain junction region [Macaca mulatta]MOW86795.1 immunoglobulin heavy chain junction region [Macaca mulatta]MOW86996.1 immunoglobulin heavy chain junction region [Macaca mulatta]